MDRQTAKGQTDMPGPPGPCTAKEQRACAHQWASLPKRQHSRPKSK